ncbi:MAG: hypothetical protein KatS3mg104_2173 [Phycisphaerae bacterium]|jgi:hypothetical protein|nr:MAG: hypothetical protein KatS3mg104_2173 [Phycisphaerae bacterium]
MFLKRFERLMKWFKLTLAGVISAGLVYRGNTYSEPMSSGLIVPVMCIVSAVLLMVTTIALTCWSSEPTGTHD